MNKNKTEKFYCRISAAVMRTSPVPDFQLVPNLQPVPDQLVPSSRKSFCSDCLRCLCQEDKARWGVDKLDQQVNPQQQLCDSSRNLGDPDRFWWAPQPVRVCRYGAGLTCGVGADMAARCADGRSDWSTCSGELTAAASSSITDGNKSERSFESALTSRRADWPRAHRCTWSQSDRSTGCTCTGKAFRQPPPWSCHHSTESLSRSAQTRRAEERHFRSTVQDGTILLTHTGPWPGHMTSQQRHLSRKLKETEISLWC